MAKTTQKAKVKPKAKPAGKPRPAPKTKPAAKPSPAAIQAARRKAAARQAERREERPHTPAPAAQVEPSKGFLYPILKFFWLLFHPGKTAHDFDVWYRNN